VNLESGSSMSEQASALWVLADPTRRKVFERVATGPVSVTEIAARLPVSRPAVSQHLKALKDAGLVLDEAVGTRRLYRVNPDGLSGLRDWFDQLWATALAAYAAEADTANEAAAAPVSPTDLRSQTRNNRPRRNHAR
jgi:DNA-binding transcriptional ArsR family regulator